MVSLDMTRRSPVRLGFVIESDKKIRATLTYPMISERAFDKVMRLLDSCQLTARHCVAMLVKWHPGQDVINPPAISEEAAKHKFPTGWKPRSPILALSPDHRTDHVANTKINS